MRVCPQCRNRLTAGQIVAFSDMIECPHCGATLRVADGSRIIGAFVALLVAHIVWRLSLGSGGVLSWLMPEVYAILTFCFAYTFYLMFAANVSARPPEPVTLIVNDSHGHAPAHH